jgi:flagellar hook-associated protein 1 FlgK
MPGLFGNLSLASKALMAHQAAIQVTSRNIANVNNPEHARQRVIMGDRAFVPTSQGPEGTGVEVLTVEQMRDAFLDKQVVRQIADEASLQAQSDALTNAELAMGDRIDRSTDPASVQDVTKSTSGIGAALDEFFNAFDALAVSPRDIPARNVALQKAQILADRINNADSRLATVQSDLATQVEADLNKANVLLSDIARLNSEIADANIRESGSASDLIDRRQGKLEALSGILKIETALIPNGYGQIEVRIGGLNFVDYGQKLGDLRYDAVNQVVTSTQDLSQTLATGGGSVDGRLVAMKGAIQEARTRVQLIAASLATEVNGVYDSAGIPAEEFFSTNGLAAGQLIALNSGIDSSRLKTSSQSLAGGNDYLTGIAGLRTSTVVGLGNLTLGDYTRNTVGQIGQVLQGVNTRLEESTVIKTALTTQRDAVSSVSLDEETADLMKFQRAYQANARVISVVDELLDTLINRMVR